MERRMKDKIKEYFVKYFIPVALVVLAICAIIRILRAAFLINVKVGIALTLTVLTFLAAGLMYAIDNVW